MVRPILFAAAVLAGAVPAAARDVVITDAALKGRSYESLVASPTALRRCLGAPLAVRNGASRAVAIDLYEAQTDVGFPIGRLAPGASRPLDLTRPARIVILDAASGKAIAYVEVMACGTDIARR